MEKDTSKSTMLVISTGFLIIYLVFKVQFAVTVSLIIGLIGIISPFLSRKIEWIWMYISKILGYIVPNVLLTLVFYLILFPLSMLAKMFSKDPLMLSDKYDSFFVDVKRKTDKKSIENIW